MDSREILARLMAASQDLVDKGMMNLQKLLEALTFAAIRVEARSYRGDVPSAERIGEIRLLIADLPDEIVPEPVRALFGRALDHYGADPKDDLPYEVAPDLFVCRNCGHLSVETAPKFCPVCGEAEGVFRRFQGMFNGDNAEPTDPRLLIDLLEDNSRRIQSAVAGLTESDLKRSPFPGRWCLQDHVVHFYQAQSVLIERIALMLSKDSPRLDSAVPYEIESAEESGSGRTQKILGAYLTERRKLIARIRGLGIPELWRKGRHEDFGLVSVMHQIKYFAQHEQAHLGTIMALRNAVAR